jgi:GNAT superfamily N-acetyltransferase
MENELDVAWCRDQREAPELGRFFDANITPEYISHSELQGPRALAPGKWRPGIVDVFTREIAERIGKTAEGLPKDDTSYPVLAARLKGELVGFALVSFFPKAPVPYGILEDIVVTHEIRHRGLGTAIIRWVEREALGLGCGRLFLESGITNDHAHHLFEREGFATCSIVMMKELKPAS